MLEGLTERIQSARDNPEFQSRIWHELTPDEWSSDYMEKNKQTWRIKYKDYSLMELYELLLNDEGYWHEVNNLIANLPPAPESVHSSTVENFYRKLLPWAGVSQDWLNDSTVIKTQTVSESGQISERPIRTVFHYNHKRPQGMGVELSALHAKHIALREGGKIWNRNEKLLDGIVNVVAAGGNVAKDVANILDPNDKDGNVKPSAIFSFTTIVIVLGMVATAALWVR